MHKLIGGIALLFLVGGAGSSAHADGPWCVFYDASTYNCGFYSFEQCYETVRGGVGRAGPIFSRTSVTAGRQDGARQQADVTDPCRTSGLRRAGKRGSVRLNTSWRCSEMRRRAISRPSATLLVAAALGLGVAAAHAGPCSSRIAQFEQAVRQSAGNPNAGPMAPQSIGAQLDVQPTPASVRRAEEQAKAAFAATLARAKRLDKQGNRVGCTRALAAAKRMYNL